MDSSKAKANGRSTLVHPHKVVAVQTQSTTTCTMKAITLGIRSMASACSSGPPAIHTRANTKKTRDTATAR